VPVPGPVPRRFVLVDLGHQRVQDVLGQRIGLARLGKLNQVPHDEAYLHLVGRLPVFEPVVVPDVDGSCLIHVEPEVSALQDIHQRP
jgi:hypothetical protein